MQAKANAPVELTSVGTSVGHSCSWIGADHADHENKDEDREDRDNTMIVMIYIIMLMRGSVCISPKIFTLSPCNFYFLLLLFKVFSCFMVFQGVFMMYMVFKSLFLGFQGLPRFSWYFDHDFHAF